MQIARNDGDNIIEFLSRFCRHPRGPDAGKPVLLVPEQQKVLREMFIPADDGLWQHREAAIVVHRKWAKTLTSSGIGLYMLTTRGMGIEIYFAANSRVQAGILKKNVDAFAISSRPLRRRLQVYKNKIEAMQGQSHIMVLGADAHQAHGYNPFVSVIDEYWAFRNNDLPEALSSGTAARPESMTLYITTPGVDMNSPLGELLERSERGDDSLYVYWPGKDIRDDVDIFDRETWREYNLGFRYGWTNERFLQSQAMALPKGEFVRLHLGGWLKRSGGWMDMYKWDDCKDSRMQLRPDVPICIFVDGAWKHDSMALMACTIGHHPELHTLKIWERPVYDDTWRVPYEELDVAVRTACAMYKVAQVGADPFFLGQLLQQWEYDGIPILEIPTNSTTRSVPATKRFFDAVMETRIKQDGNPVLRRHIANCVPKVDARGLRIARDRNNPTAFIDGAVAAVFVHDMASKVAQEPGLWMY